MFSFLATRLVFRYTVSHRSIYAMKLIWNICLTYCFSYVIHSKMFSYLAVQKPILSLSIPYIEMSSTIFMSKGNYIHLAYLINCNKKLTQNMYISIQKYQTILTSRQFNNISNNYKAHTNLWYYTWQ